LLFFSALAFVWLNLARIYPPELRSVNLDVEWLYRRLAPAVISKGLTLVDAATSVVSRLSQRLVPLIAVSTRRLNLASRPSLTGSMVFRVVIVLATGLLLGSL
jgi:multicomponent Na+:H+ antiporter subunit D